MCAFIQTSWQIYVCIDDYDDDDDDDDDDDGDSGTSGM